ncbi:metallophosphoesterase, partial [Streptomyces sp. SID7982]|nr:metallophosphoesterase [Streptomyces sp. SID7982]
LSPADDNVWTRNGATQVAREAHTSTFQGITVSQDTIRYEAVIGAKWDDRSTTDKEVGETLDAFTITKNDDGVKYVTEDGVAVPPAARR